jgi:hypothetical protein
MTEAAALSAERHREFSRAGADTRTGTGGIVECVTLAEELGYESGWMEEGHGGDQFAILTACTLVIHADSAGHGHQQRLCA